MIDDGSNRRQVNLTWFRVVVCLALAASVVITWPLWNVRAAPPLLPLAPLAQLSLGAPLIAACVIALAAPRLGAILVTAIVALGMVADQTRMQPEFFSLPILLWGTLPCPSFRLMARVHLIALWFFAGFHKLLSADYLADAGPRLIHALPLPLSAGVVPVAVVGIALIEIGTAALAVIPQTRRGAAWLALVLHAGVLFAFSPIAQVRNPAVWPWNVALALSGFALIAPWRTRLTSDLLAVPFPIRFASAAILIAPLGFYAGVVDAYPAHHLYSAATARATVYCPAGCRPEQDVNATWYAFNVPLPPQPRLYRAAFAATCSPGDVLRISGQRPPFWEHSEPVATYSCPAGSLPAAHP